MPKLMGASVYPHGKPLVGCERAGIGASKYGRAATSLKMVPTIEEADKDLLVFDEIDKCQISAPALACHAREQKGNMLRPGGVQRVVTLGRLPTLWPNFAVLRLGAIEGGAIIWPSESPGNHRIMAERSKGN